VKSVLKPAKLLIVSNSIKTGPLWAYSLQVDNFDVIMEPDPAKALRRWSDEHPNLVIFDLTTEEPAVLGIVRVLREEATVPILLLIQSKTEEYALQAYAAGADECISKPLSPSLFHAKVKAWLRRSWTVSSEMLDPIRVGNVQLIPSERSVAINNGSPIRLTNLELRLLYTLMNRPGRTVSDEELIQRVWGYDGEADNTALKNVVYRLRGKVEVDRSSPVIIHTVPGVGYKFALD
jgi:DNA-binding response OmpR family regulator